jgi:hypothetical protein
MIDLRESQNQKLEVPRAADMCSPFILELEVLIVAVLLDKRGLHNSSTWQQYEDIRIDACTTSTGQYHGCPKLIVTRICS